MAKNRIQMPSSMGGLVRYFDEYKSKIEFQPGHVVIMAVAIAVIIWLLHIFGSALLGLK